MNENTSAPDGEAPGLLRKLLGLVVGALLLTVAFAFSLVALAIAAVVGAGLLAYFWWKTRKLRQELRARQTAGPNGPLDDAPGGEVFDGEAVVVETTRSTRVALPPQPPQS